MGRIPRILAASPSLAIPPAISELEKTFGSEAMYCKSFLMMPLTHALGALGPPLDPFRFRLERSVARSPNQLGLPCAHGFPMLSVYALGTLETKQLGSMESCA